MFEQPEIWPTVWCIGFLSGLVACVDDLLDRWLERKTENCVQLKISIYVCARCETTLIRPDVRTQNSKLNPYKRSGAVAFMWWRAQRVRNARSAPARIRSAAESRGGVRTRRVLVCMGQRMECK